MSASRQLAAQQKWCPDFDRIMIGLEDRLKEWVLEETQIRLKTIVLVVSDVCNIATARFVFDSRRTMPSFALCSLSGSGWTYGSDHQSMTIIRYRTVSMTISSATHSRCCIESASKESTLAAPQRSLGTKRSGMRINSGGSTMHPKR